MKKEVSVEILSIEFGVFNGAIFFNGRCAGHIQLNFRDKPKRVRNVVRRLRELGVDIKFPNHYEDNDE